MAHGYKIKGVDISELYEYTGEEPYIEIPGYLSRGSKFKFNTYNAVYNGGWGPEYAVDPSNYNYSGKDVFSLKNCAPKNTIIQIEHDADNTTLATSKLDLPFLSGLLGPTENVSREYYLQFGTVTEDSETLRATRGLLSVWHYESKDDAISGTNRVYDFNGSIDSQYILIRLVGGGGYGGWYIPPNDTVYSGGGGATAFVLMKAQEVVKTYVLLVGRGSFSLNDSGGASSISTSGGRSLIWANGGGTKTDALSAARVAITSDPDDKELLYEAFRPVCTSDFTELTELPEDRTQWPMSWGVSGKVGGSLQTLGGYFQGDSVHVSNILRDSTSAGEMFSEHQNSSYSTKSMSVTYNGETVSVPSGGSSFCGVAAHQFGKTDLSNSAYTIAVNLAKKDIKYVTQFLAGTGGGGGVLHTKSKFYDLLAEFNLHRKFCYGGDGKVSFFW